MEAPRPKPGRASRMILRACVVLFASAWVSLVIVHVLLTSHLGNLAPQLRVAFVYSLALIGAVNVMLVSLLVMVLVLWGRQ